MAQQALGTVGYEVSSYTGLVPGLISTVIIAAGGFVTLSHMMIKAKRNGEHYNFDDSALFLGEERKTPNFFVALLPLLVVFICYSVLGMEFFFAALLGILVNLVFMGKYLPKKDEKGEGITYLQSAVKSMNLGANSFPNALMSVATPAGLASVITATAAFGIVVEKISTANIHYVFLTILAVCIIVAITSSNPVAIMTAVPLVMTVITAQGITPNISAIARVSAIAATTFETLPINGFIIVALGLAGTSHKESYKPMFLMSVAWTFIGTLVAGILFVAFPGLS